MRRKNKNCTLYSRNKSTKWVRVVFVMNNATGSQRGFIFDNVFRNAIARRRRLLQTPVDIALSVRFRRQTQSERVIRNESARPRADSDIQLLDNARIITVLALFRFSDNRHDNFTSRSSRFY